MKEELIHIYNPDFIYVPIDDILVKSNSKIYVNTLLGKKNGKEVYSSVSGTIKGTCDINDGNEISNAIVIENNYKDELKQLSGVKKDVYDYNVTELKEITKLEKKNYILDINSKVDAEYVKEYTEEILKTLDVIDIVNKNYQTKIYVNKKDKITIKKINSILGTYPNLTIIYNKKGKENKFIKPIEIIDLYNKLKQRKERNTTIILINYKNIDKYIETKKYTYLEEILLKLKIKYKKINVITTDNKIINNSDITLNDSVNEVKIL